MATRRDFLGFCLTGSVALSYSRDSLARAPELVPAPSCSEAAKPTPRQTEGPYYKARTPEKTDFLKDAPGEKITLMGHVLDRRCKRIEGVVVDMWQADAKGDYDNAGYRLRGHHRTDSGGRYWLQTIIPGNYPGRTRHFHFKLTAPGRRTLTTQLYLPGESGNGRDGIFNAALLVKLDQSPSEKFGRFDFVLDG